MIIMKIQYGLGNQMFQYAFIKSIAEDLGTDFLLDYDQTEEDFKTKCINLSLKLANPFYKFFSSNSSKINAMFLYPPGYKFNEKEPHEFFGLDCFNIEESCLNKDKLNKVKADALKNIFIDNDLLHFKKPKNIDLNHLNRPFYVIGNFPFEEYFIHHEDLIREDFKFITPLDGLNKEIANDIENTNSIAIHIRRGDYMKSPNHSLATLKYYQDAIDYMVKSVENPKFFIFSNDPEWVKENISLNYDAYYVSNNSSEKGYEDLRLMSLCKHFIIANSTFSWWGAWLSKNEDKIVIKPYPYVNSRAHELGNLKSKSLVSIKNDYSHYFDDSDVELAKITSNNFEDFVSKKVNVSSELNDTIKLISLKDNKFSILNSKIILKNLNRKRKPNKWSILKISFKGIGVDVLDIFYLTEDKKIYNFVQCFPFVHDDNEEIEAYIPISPDISLDDLIIRPARNRGNGMYLKSIELREIEIPREFK